MTRQDGTTATTPQESADVWRQAWSSVSTHDPTDDRFDAHVTATAIHRFETWLTQARSACHLPPTADHDRPFKPKETARALRKLKNFKRHGMDGLAPDLLRHGGGYVVHALNLAHNFYFQHGVQPEDWNTSPC